MKNGWNEQERLKALEDYQVLDTPNESDFDDIVKIASHICETPISLVSLVTSDRQWFKAKIGVEITETPLGSSICSHAILQEDMLIVPDASKDPRFTSNPLVSGDPHIRFYAGALLKTSEGLPLGTLCVIDYKERKLSAKQEEMLEALARQVMAQLELRRTLREQRKSGKELISENLALGVTVQDRTSQLMESLTITQELEERSRLAAVRSDINEALVGQEDTQLILQKCAKALVNNLNASFARIWILNEAEQVLELEASAGLYTHLDGPHKNVKVGEYKIGRIAASGKALLTNSVATDPNISSPEWAKREGMVAFAGYPMKLDGRVIGVMGMFSKQEFSETAFTELEPITTNISQWLQRKQIEGALQVTEDRLEATLSASEIATWSWDVPNNRVHADSNLAVMFSLNSADANGGPIESYTQAVHPEDKQRLKNEIDHCLKNPGNHLDIDYRLTAPDGSIRWVTARGKVGRDIEGNPIRFPGVVMDITARKQIEDELRESEEKFRALADNISQFAWMAEPSGMIFWYNQRWFKYTGTDLAQMAGFGWMTVHHPDYVEKVTANYKDHCARGEKWEDTFPLRGKDGNYRWFLSRAFPILNSEGVITRWFGTNTDITELRNVQNALKEAQSNLADQNHALDELVQNRTARLQETITELESFSFSMSHDMRSPLRAMQGYSDALLKDHAGDLNSEAKQYLDRIHRGATRLDLLIRDVLAYSKVAKGEVEMKPLDYKRR